ncbi:MAG: hypothetical protein AAF844_05955 [Pseudomonadota bacterium]
MLDVEIQTPPPLPSFLDARAEAESWAALLDEGDAAAYAWLAVKRLPLERRAALAGLLLRDLAERSPDTIQDALQHAVETIQKEVAAVRPASQISGGPV